MMWAKQVKAEKQAREHTDDGSGTDEGQRSPVLSEGDVESDLGGLSRSATLVVGQTSVVPRSQEEAVGVETQMTMGGVVRKETVTPPAGGAGGVGGEGTSDGANDGEERRGGLLRPRMVSTPSELRRSASGTSLRRDGHGREVRWDTTGLREALGKK